MLQCEWKAQKSKVSDQEGEKKNNGRWEEETGKCEFKKVQERAKKAMTGVEVQLYQDMISREDYHVFWDIMSSFFPGAKVRVIFPRLPLDNFKIQNSKQKRERERFFRALAVGPLKTKHPPPILAM